MLGIAREMTLEWNDGCAMNGRPGARVPDQAADGAVANNARQARGEAGAVVLGAEEVVAWVVVVLCL